MTITIHGAFYSTCTQRVLTTLVEKNVDDWKLESIDMMKGQHKSPEYLQNLQVSHPQSDAWLVFFDVSERPLVVEFALVP